MPSASGATAARWSATAWEKTTHERDCAFSPDGDTLYYLSDRGDGTDVWRAHRADTNKTWASNTTFVRERLTSDDVCRRSLTVSPDGRLLAVANFGADELELFAIDREHERLRLLQSVAVDFGRQPRHMVFHPDGKHLYLLTESGNRVYVYRLANDALTELAAYSTLDPDKRAEGMAADIAVSPDGAFLYATNRSQNNIAVWRVLPGGLLDSVGWYDCGGAGPRGIAVSHDGGTLFCANNDSGAVAVLPLNPATGAPGRPVRTLEVPAAACVRVR